ncbi:MAG: hypothetical protein MHM6MM_005098 [Cercozoa sp. M6MM]
MKLLIASLMAATAQAEWVSSPNELYAVNMPDAQMVDVQVYQDSEEVQAAALSRTLDRVGFSNPHEEMWLQSVKVAGGTNCADYFLSMFGDNPNMVDDISEGGKALLVHEKAGQVHALRHACLETPKKDVLLVAGHVDKKSSAHEVDARDFKLLSLLRNISFDVRRIQNSPVLEESKHAGRVSDEGDDVSAQVYQCGDTKDTCQCGANNPFPCCSNGGNCTWYAWHSGCCHWGINVPARRNAKEWSWELRNAGWKITTGPRVNSISIRKLGDYGHVAWVYKVSGGNVHVREQGCWGWYGTRSWTYSSTYFQEYATPW